MPVEPDIHTAIKIYNAQYVVLPGTPKMVEAWNVDGPIGVGWPLNALPQHVFDVVNGSLTDDAATIVELQAEIAVAP